MRTYCRKPASPFRFFNSSPEVIRLVTLMYVRFPLSLRKVEDLLFERGIDISYETVRFWWNRSGPLFAFDVRRSVSAGCGASGIGGTSTRYVKINGEMHYLWRAVDHEGEVPESYVTKTSDKKAALAFMKRALKRYGSPEAITPDGLRSYEAAMDELGDAKKQHVGHHANNRGRELPLAVPTTRAGDAEVPTMRSLQKFASVHANVHNHFNLERHIVDRQTFKERRSATLAEWQSLVS